MKPQLKKLEISGFKSFAKPCRFEFSPFITAIVGPNGSGKSNIAEAIRWVLGEQSLKSLRGKKGEDLIFSGSHTSPRLSKASVYLVFDNSKKQFPLDFNEVTIGRRVYRDGQGEYLVNGSEVRLKEMVELLSHVGLGVSHPHIISQGESDRILYVSSSQRQDMIEDALGLKIYQYKRQDAEKKLVKTEENMRHAQALRKEIQPHLQHLERLCEKFKKTSEIKAELKETLKEYLARMRLTLKGEEKELDAQKSVPHKEAQDLEKKLAELRRELHDLRDRNSQPKELIELEKELASIREKRAGMERELGRLEGIFEAASTKGMSEEDTIPREEVENMFIQTEDTLSLALETDNIDEVHGIVQEALSRLGDFFNRLTGSHAEDSGFPAPELAKRRQELEAALGEVNKKEKILVLRHDTHRSSFYEKESQKRRLEDEVMHSESKLSGYKEILRDFVLQEEKLRLRREEFQREFNEAGHYIETSEIPSATPDPISEREREKMRRAIDHLKFRLEEAGGVDFDVLKEHEELRERDLFFERELADLAKSAKGLREISRELAKKIENDFTKGLEKITKEFQRFFEAMFGGGYARLYAVSRGGLRGRRNKDEDLSAEVSVKESGVEIDVRMPWKKIKGLDMLSGGERALTSIAFLFAMATVKPPPFLVLDETDSALDEANSRRYAELLKKLSHTTQIITITHNRETMKQTDVLYGVTVGSDGVSRLLSLKFSEAKDFASN
ncbi:AAA family ATPase [Patescibacteria group bacterium]|nr:AAA family ATPase [Patescibacteria group bacterium]